MTEPTMDLATVADELYGLTLEEFTPTRNQRAKEAKAEVGKDLAGEIKALPKPTTAAWAVNMLVRHQAEQVEQVLTLGGALRQAQENLDGQELRQLNQQRRQLTAAVTQQARTLARDLGHRIGDPVATAVQETLHAAMTDQDAEDAVRSGRLVTSLSSTGLGPVDVTGAVGAPGPGRPTPIKATPGPPDEKPKLTVVPDDTRAIDDAQREVERAESAAKDAKKQLARAEKKIGKLEAHSMELEARLEELRLLVTEKENELEQVEDDLGTAEEARDEAAETHEAARRTADEAQAALERLQS